MKKSKYVIFIIILIIIIILLLFAYWLGYRMGKIGYDVEPTIPVFKEEIAGIKVTDDTMEIQQDEELNIFSNVKFDNEAIIAPNSYGSYKFYIENVVDNNIKYALSFTDEMTNKINMKYRLKLDNVYIRGNKEEYVSIEDLSIEDITVMEDSVNVFVLEWYWEDDDQNDTYTGSLESDQYYTLKLQIQADTLE